MRGSLPFRRVFHIAAVLIDYLMQMLTTVLTYRKSVDLRGWIKDELLQF